MNEEEEKKHFAVLIDADNISEKYAASIFDEIADYGYASYRRIYGNWAKGNGWKEDTLLENSINPIQQFNYTTGKNATDMAMVIDAMDILYSGKGGRLLPGDQRQRFYQAGDAAARGADVRDRDGRVQNPAGPDQGLQQVHPPRPDLRGAGGKERGQREGLRRRTQA